MGDKSSLNILEIDAFQKNIAYYNIPDLMLDKSLSKSLIAYVDCPELKKDYNCVSSIPHPFSFLHFAGIVKENGVYKNKCNYKDGLGIVKLANAIEVMNGHLLKRGNKKASELAHDMNKAFTGGSDGHIRFDWQYKGAIIL